MATRLDPFAEMDRLMSQVFGSGQQRTLMPMDLYRTGDHYVVSIDLPGVDPGSIDVSVEDRTLTVRAERTVSESEDVRWFARERAQGTFARQLTVGPGLDLEHIEARYTDGVLTLMIPVAEEAKPRRIEVQHGAKQAIDAATAA